MLGNPGVHARVARGTVDPVRARVPDRAGYAVQSGVRIYYEVFGDGPTTLVLLPTWAIVHSRTWKMQIPYLSRHFRVVTFDTRGNGRSDRPTHMGAYSEDEIVADVIAVMDATDTDSAVCIGVSMGAGFLLRLATDYPDRVLGGVFVGPAVGIVPVEPPRVAHPFTEVFDEDEGWYKYNAAYWQRDFAGFARWFFSEIYQEPHSTKGVDDGTEWALETTPEILIQTQFDAYLDARGSSDLRPVAVQLAERVTCPSLVVHGDQDTIVGSSQGRALADALGCRLEIFAGCGHAPHNRHPVRFNALVREFVDSIVPPPPDRPAAPWVFARERKPSALWISSPIGLGHVLRDLAIARAVRQRVPDLRIEWLAQPPVTAVLEAEGEIVHAASTDLASESAHWESESAGHDLHAFYAFRRMDEILCANYGVFDDVVRDTSYDLWVGDESWEVDHYLHENPERKTAPYAFLTDVIGYLPVGGADDPREVDLCADYNAEMIDHVARFPYVRDRALFLGSFAELPDASLGAGLPGVREWSARNFTSVPYVVPFEPAAYRRTGALRNKLGYGTGYPLYVAAVGGTSVGHDLLALTAEAFELVRKEQPDARMVMVCGPRLDPAAVPDVEGMDKVGYVPSLFEHLACADAAIVQGGLSTTMELVAARRPFVYFPLANHWEQQRFVSHRLDHYGAGLRMDYAQTSPRDLANAICSATAIQPNYRPVRKGGADRAAAMVSSLLRR
jgi:pimeloyl-ACP methyl ester carboxylesterase/UDP:flavonoid glycosyltransferase YjiC (YdhE family)